MAWLINEGTNFLTSGSLPERRGNAHPNIVPYDAFECRDGHILLAVGNDAQFARYCDALDLAALAVDPKFQTNLARIENRMALMDQIRPAMKTWAKADLLAQLQAIKVPCGPINTIDEALSSDQAQARAAVIAMPRPDVAGGMLQLLGNPLKLSRTPVQYQRPPPRFGQDTRDVLETWGPDAPQKDDQQR